MQKLTPEIIHAAIDGFEAQKQKIDSQIAELRAMLNGGPATPAATPATTKKGGRQFSPAALQRMREAQQRRWAKVKRETAPVAVPKPKRKISAAGRKRIAEAQKKRWAANKAA
jgi:hypothetical protein